MDISTGFSNSYNSYSNWKFSLGTEIFKFKNVIYRLGYSFGGNNSSDLSYGMGYVIGPFFGQNWDFSFHSFLEVLEAQKPLLRVLWFFELFIKFSKFFRFLGSKKKNFQNFHQKKKNFFSRHFHKTCPQWKLLDSICSTFLGSLKILKMPGKCFPSNFWVKMSI